MIIYNVIKPFLIGWLISNFEPLQELNRFLIKKIKNEKVKSILKYVNFIHCGKCISFWTSLIIYQNIWIAILTAFIYFVYEKLINSIRVFI